MKAGCDRSNSRSSALFWLVVTTSGEAKLTAMGTVQVGRAALGVLDLDVGRRHHGSRGQAESGFGVCGRRQHDVTRVSADRDHGAGVGAHGHGDIAQDLSQLIELFEIDIRCGGWRAYTP